LKLGPLNLFSTGPGNIASKLISKIYGVDISSTTHNEDFSTINGSNSSYNLNNISYPESTLFKTILVAIACLLSGKFKRKGSKIEEEL
jgi:hypothetical protein